MTDRNQYSNPLINRYAGKEMSRIFSDQYKFSTWRKLWVWLAEAQKELGLAITDVQIAEMMSHLDDINFEDAEKFEREFRHDVMAHVHAYGKQCPTAKGIIHLGATSAYVGDNTDLLQMRDAMLLVLHKLVNLVDQLARFAEKHADLPTLGFTHFQPAQVVTVGKRACLWAQDFLFDIAEAERFIKELMALGVKGTTGTQASFLSLFHGDAGKVEALDKLVTKKMGFERSFPVTGQTYPRKMDAWALSVLSGIAQSAHKFSNDVRLLQHLREAEEPFEDKQIGSSAMAYKRNPMRSERIASLSRYLITLALNPAMTAAEQWFERTLDDSANKRLSVPQAFLSADAILIIASNVGGGLVVNPAVIRQHLDVELPFMATEEILMSAVEAGGDRQHLHELIRRHSLESARLVKDGGRNDLLDRLAKDPAFAAIAKRLPELTSAGRFVGLSGRQTLSFIRNEVEPLRSKYHNHLKDDEDKVKV